MNKEIKLEVASRKEDEKISNVKNEGNIPAVVYGHSFENKALKLNKNDFVHILSQVKGCNIFKIVIDGKEEVEVLVKDVQFDTIQDDPIHVDFLKVNKDRKVKVEVPFKFVGESGAVRKKGGMLSVSKESLKIQCLPEDLKSELEIDLSSLEDFTDSVRVNSLNLGDKYEIMAAPGDLIAKAERPRKVEVEEVVEKEETPEAKEGEGGEAKEGEGGEAKEGEEKK